jgi:hypothetical protein
MSRPAGGDADPKRGVWLAGHPVGRSPLVEISRRARVSDRAWRAVLTAVAALPGIDHATSGNVLLTGTELTGRLAELSHGGARPPPRRGA